MDWLSAASTVIGGLSKPSVKMSGAGTGSVSGASQLATSDWAVGGGTTSKNWLILGGVVCLGLLIIRKA